MLKSCTAGSELEKGGHGMDYNLSEKVGSGMDTRICLCQTIVHSMFVSPESRASALIERGKGGTQDGLQGALFKCAFTI